VSVAATFGEAARDLPPDLQPEFGLAPAPDRSPAAAPRPGVQARSRSTSPWWRPRRQTSPSGRQRRLRRGRSRGEPPASLAPKAGTLVRPDGARSTSGWAVGGGRGRGGEGPRADEGVLSRRSCLPRHPAERPRVAWQLGVPRRRPDRAGYPAGTRPRARDGRPGTGRGWRPTMGRPLRSGAGGPAPQPASTMVGEGRRRCAGAAGAPAPGVPAERAPPWRAAKPRAPTRAQG